MQTFTINPWRLSQCALGAAVDRRRRRLLRNDLTSWQVNISGGTQADDRAAADVSYDDPDLCVVATAGGVPVQASWATPSLAF
jgi:hypothetical protein